MSLPLRPSVTPQCLSCLRRYALNAYGEVGMSSSALRQQIRGKRKMANNSAMVTVRLRQDVEAYGRQGSIVPIPRGEMRNVWYPSGKAEYVTVPELKKLRLSNASFTVERDFQYTLKKPKKIRAPIDEANRLTEEQITSASAFQKKVELDRVTPERSVELIEFFVGPQLEFYRQPIIEEKEAGEGQAKEETAGEEQKRAQFGSGAAADLLAARMQNRSRVTTVEEPKVQAIYGSVSTLDVLQAVRAALEVDDEAKRVVLSEQDVEFVDLAETEGGAGKVLKHVGDFPVQINVRGAGTPVRRMVRVIPQELER